MAAHPVAFSDVGSGLHAPHCLPLDSVIESALLAQQLHGLLQCTRLGKCHLHAHATVLTSAKGHLQNPLCKLALNKLNMSKIQPPSSAYSHLLSLHLLRACRASLV